MGEFDGRTAIVTGAGSGIGQAVAFGLAAGGALVGVNDLSLEAAQGTVDAIVAAGGRAESLVYDVARSAAVDAAVDDFVARHSRLDVMINNAGILVSVPGHGELRAAYTARRAAGGAPGSLSVTVNTSDEVWHRHFDVMLHGVFYGTRAALRHMEPAGRGAIVNTASVGAFHPAPDFPYYSAAKAAVVNFTSSVGHEVAGAGIRVNAVAPGTTRTGISRDSATGSQSARSAAGRAGEPAEIAEVFVFLASDRASYCFGETFPVSGAFA